MIIDDRLMKVEHIPGTNFEKLTCVITKDEFLECYNAWVRPADTLQPKLDTRANPIERANPVERADALPELPQYHFERDTFVSTFEQVFDEAEIDSIEDMCRQHTTLNEFLLFYHPDWEEFYIIHLPSGTIVNWYKHLGRTNTCNKDYFNISDLKNFLERLKVDINEHTAS